MGLTVLWGFCWGCQSDSLSSLCGWGIHSMEAVFWQEVSQTDESSKYSNLSPDLRSYTAYFCPIPPGKARDSRGGERASTFKESSGKEMSCIIFLPQQPRKTKLRVSELQKKNFGGKKGALFSEAIYTLHHWQWDFVAIAMNSTVLETLFCWENAFSAWHKMPQLPNYLMVKWRNHSIILLWASHKE